MPDTARLVPSLLEILTLNPARDAEGRALLESAADQEALDEIRASYRTCGYEDSPSRLDHAKPMNAAALEQAKRNFAGMLAVLRYLREIQLGVVDGRELVADDWRRICISGEMLPRFLYLRRSLADTTAALEDYYAYPIPADVSTLFKTVRGVAKMLDYLHDNASEVAARMPKDMAARLGVSRPKAGPKKTPKRGSKVVASKPLGAEALRAYRAARWTTDDLVWVAEAFDLFVGETEVCAAPTNMVRATLDALIDGRNPHDELDLTDELKELIGDGARFVRFCDVLDRTYRELRRFREKCRHSVERMMHELRSLSQAQRGRALAIYLDDFDRYLIPERRFLEHCRAAQAELLDAAGCTDPPPPLDLDFVDRLVPENRRSLAFQHFSVRVAHTDTTIDVSITTGGQTATESVPYAPD